MKTQLLVHDLQNVYRFIQEKEYHNAMKLLEDIIVDVSFLPDEDKVTIELARITAERYAFKSIVEEVMEAFQIHKLPKVLQAVKSDYEDALKGEYKGKGDLTEEERATLKDSM